MSSRALRKLQREKEQAAVIKEEEETDSDGDAPSPTKAKALNAFQMLNAAAEDENEGSDSERDGTQDPDDGENEIPAPVIPEADTKAGAKKAKKKKKKGKGKTARQTAETGKPAEPAEDEGLDEIDLALKSLSAKENQDIDTPAISTIDAANAQLYSLLAVEAKHLNALNEMKRLFGNVVLENNEEGPAASRRRGRGPQTVDLGGALTARHSPVSKGQGLKGLALKRNPLMIGKEEWPQATSGGLGMETVEKMEDGTTEYRFVHNSIYQGVQKEFESCVASMDPQRLITMLIFNRR